jgi:hypothetical protein
MRWSSSSTCGAPSVQRTSTSRLATTTASGGNGQPTVFSPRARPTVGLRTFFTGQVALSGADQLWHSFAPMKFRFHGWLAIWHRCWTADRLQRHVLPNHAICPLCNAAAETYDHLSLQCPLATTVWLAAFQLQGWHPPMPTATSTIREWWPAAELATTTGNRRDLNSLVILDIRSLWLERNTRVFDARASSAMDVSRRIADEWPTWGACRRGAVRA